MSYAARGAKLPIRLHNEEIPGVVATMIHPDPAIVVLCPDGEHVERVFFPPDVAMYYSVSWAS